MFGTRNIHEIFMKLITADKSILFMKVWNFLLKGHIADNMQRISYHCSMLNLYVNIDNYDY